LEHILVVFGDMLLCKILDNLKTSLRMNRFAEKVFVVNKVILNFYMCFINCIVICSNLCVI